MRSAYAVLPAPRRPVRFHREDVADAFTLGGPDGLRVVLRDLLADRVRGRASSPAEVALLRQWIAEEVEEHASYWTARLSRAEEPEPVGEPDEDDEEEAPAAILVCSSCGGLFGVPAGRPGRPRRRCYTCSPPR